MPNKTLQEAKALLQAKRDELWIQADKNLEQLEQEFEERLKKESEQSST